MFYTVFSTNDNPAMQWQSELLENSWKQVGQEGALIRLVATDTPDALPTHKYAQSIATKKWDNNPKTGDHYPIYNKPASLLEWVYRDQPEGTVFLLDPDCVFRKPVYQRVVPGSPVGQKWLELQPQEPNHDSPFGLGSGFSFLSDYCANPALPIDPVMIPTLIHTRDLRRIGARWLELTGLIRERYRNADGEPIRESDMFAYIVACAEYGLVHEAAALGICTNWNPSDVPDYPVIHYCQSILGRQGEVLFSKYSYKPWSAVDTAVEPEHQYGTEFLKILEDQIINAGGAARPAKLSTQPLWAEGVMEGRLLDEMLLERRSDKASLWLNMSGIAIWELCDGSRTVKQIGDALSAEFDVEPDVLVPDVLATVDRLRAIGFLSFQ